MFWVLKKLFYQRTFVKINRKSGGSQFVTPN